MIAIYSLISIAVLAWMIFGLYNDFRVDRLRQNLFFLRDRLFDDAADGRIAFDSRAYRNTRLMLNGLIRFGHRVSLSAFFGHRLLLGQDRMREAGADFEVATFRGVPERDQALCQRYINEANRLVALHLLSSPTLIVGALGLLPLLTVGLARHGVDAAGQVVQRWARSFKALDDVAFEEGKLLA